MNFFKLALFFLLTASSIFGQDFTVDLIYTKHTLPFVYPYLKETREFRPTEISSKLDHVDSFKSQSSLLGSSLGVLRNYSNLYGKPIPTPNNTIDKFKIEKDAYGNLRHQGIPLFSSPTATVPERYARDGELISFYPSENDRAEVSLPLLEGHWYIPMAYIKALPAATFEHAIAIDIKNQNIMTLERQEGNWIIRSMTHSTTGANRPPHAFPTEPGLFVLQTKLPKMPYLKDGSKTEIEGFAPFASRFSGGGYIHGVPVNLPQTEIIEATPTLGTIPRSHKCVRTRSSHAQFIYDWAPIHNTLVVILN